MKVSTMGFYKEPGVAFRKSPKLTKAVRERLNHYVNSIKLDDRKTRLDISYTAHCSNEDEDYYIQDINYKVKEFFISINITRMAQSKDRLTFFLDAIERAVHDILKKDYGYSGENGSIFEGLAEECRQNPDEWAYVKPKHWKDEQVGVIVL